MMLPVDLYRVKHDSRDAVKTTRVKAEAKDFQDRGRRQGLSDVSARLKNTTKPYHVSWQHLLRLPVIIKVLKTVQK